MRNVLNVLNVPKHLCRAALGKDHTPRHRMAAGAVLMLIGVGIAKSGGEVHAFWLHFTCDLFGYFFHGAGSVPFLDYLLDD